MDHAGLPLRTVLEQLEMLGGEVVPVLRKEFESKRPAHVPAGPTHTSLKASTGAEEAELAVTGLRPAPSA
jgi:hypothetical protein